MVARIISQLLKKQMDRDHLHSWTNIQVNGPGSTEATKNFQEQVPVNSFWSPEGGAGGGLGGGLSFVAQSRGSGGKTDAILTPPAPFNSVANHPKPAAEKTQF